MRVEQRNSTLLELGYFDDGPYEVGDENRLDPDLVPVPPNSYLGRSRAPSWRFSSHWNGFTFYNETSDTLGGI